MSYFPNKSPHESMLEWAGFVKDEFELTQEELVIVLLQVANVIADPLESKSDELKKRQMRPEQ